MIARLIWIATGVALLLAPTVDTQMLFHYVVAVSAAAMVASCWVRD